MGTEEVVLDPAGGTPAERAGEPGRGVAAQGCPLLLILVTAAICAELISRFGTADQKEEWLPKIASGEVVASFALTEAEAGSDPSGMTTTAVQDRDDWVINGGKRYITNAPLADVFMVFARTDRAARASRGISTFLVPRGAAGGCFCATARIWRPARPVPPPS